MADYIHELRQLVGHRPLILTTAAGALLNAQQEVLLQERTGYNDWCFPGGYMEYGERIVATLKREFKEDAGLAVAPVRLLHIFDGDCFKYPNGDEVQCITHFYLVRQTGGHLLRQQTTETSAVRYFPLTALPPFFNQQSEKMAQAVCDYVNHRSR
ncbi:NUDIX hydrolase [Fructilactobacillus myrtifloralis]|uniref:NUDIX hydrolase n=1 Tax=Fructilactobacillus myrtifloralis TaxID=2940301 RepID=A0ABY5BQF4_9LACO|nr:NUDIX hydrolase [Fructilactobacillus myrtifloralis]USS84821.1 NUDIX hydrolase [Fructilactobacillus myrtifloralis]